MADCKIHVVRRPQACKFSVVFLCRRRLFTVMDFTAKLTGQLDFDAAAMLLVAFDAVAMLTTIACVKFSDLIFPSSIIFDI